LIEVIISAIALSMIKSKYDAVTLHFKALTLPFLGSFCRELVHSFIFLIKQS
jgi:hypothetical protein